VLKHYVGVGEVLEELYELYEAGVLRQLMNLYLPKELHVLLGGHLLLEDLLDSDLLAEGRALGLHDGTELAHSDLLFEVIEFLNRLLLELESLAEYLEPLELVAFAAEIKNAALAWRQLQLQREEQLGQRLAVLGVDLFDGRVVEGMD